MRRGGDEVANIGGLFVLAFDDDGLVEFGVPWKEFDADAGNDGCVATEESRASAGDQGIVVRGEIADTIALVLLVRVDQLAALIVVAGAREGGNDGAIRRGIRCSSRSDRSEDEC